MREAGVSPNVASYRTLLARAVTHEQRKAWVEEMVAAGLAPTVGMYDQLLERELRKLD